MFEKQRDKQFNKGLTLSVLVPVFNTGSLLEPCLKSLAAQTVQNIEYICINDGSTDGSDEILNEWSKCDARFQVIHQPNGGYGKAMNVALKAAKGTWIGIVEPDDWVEPTMFQHLLELAEQTTAPIVKGSFTGERGGKSKPSGKFASHLPGTEIKPTDAIDYITGSVAIWSAIYKREWLIKNNICFSETPGASFQDLGFALRTWIAADSICVTPAAAYHYKEDNPSSSSRKLDEGAWAVLRELELQTEIFESIPTEATLKRSMLVRRILHSLQADYRIRISSKVDEYLISYSNFLNKCFPLHTLCKEPFKKQEWHDLQLLYHTPLKYPRKRRGNVSLAQRIFSCRREGGRKVLRLFGLSYRF